MASIISTSGVRLAVRSVSVVASPSGWARPAARYTIGGNIERWEEGAANRRLEAAGRARTSTLQSPSRARASSVVRQIPYGAVVMAARDAVGCRSYR